MKGKGWGRENTKEQARDALVSAVLMVVISGSIIGDSIRRIISRRKIHKQSARYGLHSGNRLSENMLWLSLSSVL